MGVLRHRHSAVLLAAITVVVATPSPAQWRLWPAFYDDAEVLDQEQPVEGSGSHVGPVDGHGAGQTFVPRKTPLVRMDFKIANKEDRRPGVVKLWKWAGSHAATVSQPPLFTDVVELGGHRNQYRVHSFYPRVDVDVGVTYFVEFSAPGRGVYTIKHSSDALDHYPDGRVRFKGGYRRWEASWDLWFRTYTTPGGRPEPAPPARPSDPSLPWSAPTRSDGRVAKSDYYKRIKARADYVRASSQASCSDGAIKGVGMLDAFLYKVSCDRGACDEKYAEFVRRMYRNAHAWHFCAPRPWRRGPACDPACKKGKAMGGFDLWQPALAYLWLKDSPTLRQDDHAAIRELLVERVRNSGNRPIVGTSNGALQGALIQLIVASLYPELPEAAEMRQHAEGTWSEFWKYRDTEEDSAEYAAVVMWPTLLAYAALSGRDDEIWSDPGFLGFVDRTFQHTTPLGVDPDFGHSVGWARDPSGLIWLFEKAATRTGDPKYKWLAHRIFDYSRTHVRGTPPRTEPLHRSLQWLAMAYFDADDGIKPAPLRP